MLNRSGVIIKGGAPTLTCVSRPLSPIYRFYESGRACETRAGYQSAFYLKVIRILHFSLRPRRNTAGGGGGGGEGEVGGWGG